MRLEISHLFTLECTSDVVHDQEIGDGIKIESLGFDGRKTKLYERLKLTNEDHYQRLAFREQFEQLPYTHRFFVAVDGITGLYDSRIRDAERLLTHSIVLTRIVKPGSIPSFPSSIRCAHYDDGRVTCQAWTYVGFYSEAYVGAKRQLAGLSQSDAKLIQDYWAAFESLYEKRYQLLRIYRALYMFNDACHIRPLNIRHIVLHAALESLICTSRNFKRRQLVQRLVQLTSLTQYQAEGVYKLCNEFKHSAAPNFLRSSDTECLTPEDQERERTTLWLEGALCELFRKTLADGALLDDLADPQRLVTKYPVQDDKGKLVE